MWSGKEDNREPNITNCFVLFSFVESIPFLSIALNTKKTPTQLSAPLLSFLGFEVCYFTHNIIVIVIAFFNFAFVIRHRTRLATQNKALTLTTAHIQIGEYSKPPIFTSSLSFFLSFTASKLNCKNQGFFDLSVSF